MTYNHLHALAVLWTLFASGTAVAQQLEAQAPSSASLLVAYPAFLDRIEGNELVWKDGTRMIIDDGKGPKTLEDLLDHPDIKDMFVMPYPTGGNLTAPGLDFDPGRIRYTPLFTKMYGDCRHKDLMVDAETVDWLPKKFGKTVEFAKNNGAAGALQAASDELDKLPDRFLDYLRPLQGTFNCRPIAGTTRPSAHGFGIAIDIAAAHSDYWFWHKPDASGLIPYRNAIPAEIVQIFEKHGFIWGGKWYHYDTMHFEYRPELLQ